MEKKKQWMQPELIVLVRRKPEEGVLQICKFEWPGGPVGMNIGCWLDWDIFCEPCDVLSET